MKFISQRCSNVNRGDFDEHKPKRAKREVTKGKHIYLNDVDSINVQDSVSFDCNLKKLSSEMLKSNPSTEVLDTLMEQTFANRRMSVLKSEISVSHLCEEYPLLRKPKHVSHYFIII